MKIKIGILGWFCMLGIALMILSCGEEQQQLNVDWASIDDEIIRDYLTEHNLQATKHPSGLYYTITKNGNGKFPNPTSVVRASYKGYLTDGNVFDQGTHEFSLLQVIQGWQIGIPLIDKGGSGLLFIPSQLGYSYQARPGIPANSVLIFEVELIDFQ